MNTRGNILKHEIHVIEVQQIQPIRNKGFRKPNLDNVTELKLTYMLSD